MADYPATKLVDDELDPEFGGIPANGWGKPARMFIEARAQFLAKAHLDYNRQPYRTVAVVMNAAGVVGQAVAFDPNQFMVDNAYCVVPIVGGIGAKIFLGILLQSASFGARAVVAIAGIVPQNITTLSAQHAGPVTVDSATGRLRPIASAEVQFGYADIQGNVFLTFDR